MRKLYILTLLISSFCTAQNLNFTIDTATDNGTTITETIVSGPDTYVLTVDHSGNEELDNLGGGDLVFFLSAIDPLTPHRLSITKNGMPTNFNLNSIDYDTLGAGTISVTNQDDEVISSPTAYALGAGSLTITNAANALSITQIKINPTDTDDLNDFGFHNINVEILDTLSTEDVSLEQSIDIFPNPSEGKITIKNSGIVLEKVVVTDLNGRTITTQNLEGITTDKDLDFSSVLSSGLYLVTISSERNSITKKLTIK
ncbi:T9SS type A sorting domain-containing protein [uncultured Psychroserpens sp.]|uniref:T9SS type A sorting domain-containing protein n=1 Tax=uncultured Psychroserpens sp. TaxID=255436 RepID=UPI0026364C5D|nr:T9SS type A sorting domain-containing protein [uncultured Psychroserpens sp.]